MITSMYNCPLSGVVPWHVFHILTSPTPRKTSYLAGSVPELLFTTVVMKLVGIELCMIKISIFGLFPVNIYWFWLRIRDPPKTSKTWGRPLGKPRAPARGAFPRIARFHKFQFSGFRAQYPGTFSTSLFSLPPGKRHIWRLLSQNFLFCTGGH